MNLPNVDIFDAHGLYDIDIDSSYARSVGESASGWATLRPRSAYPLLDPEAKGRVRFYWCSETDRDAARHFRRCCQAYAIATRPSRGAHKGKKIDTGRRVLAWWEKDGLWLITNEEKEDVVSLSRWWADRLVEQQNGDANGDAHIEINGLKKQPRGMIYADACEVFEGMARTTRHMHQHHLINGPSQPSVFGVLNRQHQRIRVEISRFQDPFGLPNFNLADELAGTPLEDNSLFGSDSIDPSNCLEEGIMKKALRYLAPEVVSTRHLTVSSDIFALGVIMHETLTGTTIDGGPDSPDATSVDILQDFQRHMFLEIPPPHVFLEREAAIGAYRVELPPPQLSEIIMKCLAKDVDERYSTTDALKYDLNRLAQVIRARGDLSKLQVGEVDRISRYKPPKTLIGRDDLVKELDQALTECSALADSETWSTKVMTVYGQSGSGKTRLLQEWSQKLEHQGLGRTFLISYSKEDEHITRPLSSFTQIFDSLLERVLTDGKENVEEWRKKIYDILGGHLDVFLKLLSPSSQRLLAPNRREKQADSIDWSNFIPAFKQWSRRLLQLFGTESRPLVLIIDDCQWLESSEIALWQHFLTSGHALNHMLVACAYRVDSNCPPPAHLILSSASTHMMVDKLPEEEVLHLLQACFHDRLDNASSLVSFLHAETAGSPLYLKSLINTLVRDHIVYFDFAVLLWRFDPLALQGHLTNRKVDEFLGTLLREFAPRTQQLLKMLSCLPSAGVPAELLSQALDLPVWEVEAAFEGPLAAGCITTGRSGQGSTFRFSHDRYRSTSHDLMPGDERTATVLHASCMLRRPEFQTEYLLVSADLALYAKDRGSVGSIESFMQLMIAAADRSALSASFESAKRFLDGYESVIEDAGGLDAVLEKSRADYFRYLKLVAEVYGVLKLTAEAGTKLEKAVSLCKNPIEDVKLALYRVRSKIWDSQYSDAMRLLLDVLKRSGYDADRPETLSLKVPRTLSEFEAFVGKLQEVTYDEDSDIRLLLSNLICAAGSTIFVALPNHWITIFSLGVSFMGELGIIQESTAYILGVYALATPDVPVRQAICDYAQSLADARHGSTYSCSAMVVLAAQVHCWSPLDQVAKAMVPAFDLLFAHGNYELTAYVVCLDVGTQLFASRPIEWQPISAKYSALRPVASNGMNMFMSIPLQYAESLSTYTGGQLPWEMKGSFLTDISLLKGLSVQQALWYTCSLRLALLYDAPFETRQRIIEDGQPFVAGVAMLTFGTEWRFLKALHWMRVDHQDPRIQEVRSHLRTMPLNIDYKKCDEIIGCLIGLCDDLVKGIAAVDKLSAELEPCFGNLHGVLSLMAGYRILEVTGSQALASGYLTNAIRSLRRFGGEGVCQKLRQQFPEYVSVDTAMSEPSFLHDFRPRHLAPPQLIRAAASSHETVTSDDTGLDDDTTKGDNLDTVTLMRSSLALASEQDPQVLMATLLRVLCQYTRADYAAIALADTKDPSSFRLVASGAYEKIAPRDLPLADEDAHAHCPANLMIKVALTGKAVTKAASTSGEWFDSFYGNKRPRTALCLPISAQGRQAGVILLSSMIIDNPRARSAAAREVISCLATFATLVAMNQSFTRRLKREVDERTKQLRDALAAKTQFLSQCSHELRSPLSAVLGLATVLRESPGLSEVQREHLQTIQSSGEDLLGLINNILDVARLENSSVSLERTPFNLREVVEAALDTMAATAQKKGLEVCLVSSFKTDPPGVMGDSFRVKQVLLNLLSNAVKFTSKGMVTVRWEHEVRKDNKVAITLYVEDTGIGIPAQKMDKLFRSFSQVDESITRSYGGSGLGLVISRDLANLMGGDCSASSEYGKGSKFTFTFVAEKDEKASTDYEVFRSPRSCFVLCPLGPSWPMLEANLTAFNCQPVRFEAELADSLEQDFPEGLNSSHDFHFVFVDIDMIDEAALKEMRRLQPKAKFVFMCNSIDLAKAMKRFSLTRESILARPIKLASLYNALIPAGDVNTPDRPRMHGRSRNAADKIDKQLAKNAPLSILLVDDNPTNVLVGRRILEMLGYKDIPSASDGLQGFEKAEKTHYDVILMDLQMPVMDGYTALERIKASPLTGQPCVVALTANADVATQDRCEKAGFFTYLSKPLNITKFESTLRSAYQYRHKGDPVDPKQVLAVRAPQEPTSVNSSTRESLKNDSVE